jgi:hypothetical protein
LLIRCAAFLASDNESTAVKLVGIWIRRVSFLYDSLQKGFEELKQQFPDNNLSEVECFALSIQCRVSPKSAEIVGKALERWLEIKKISDAVMPEAQKHKGTPAVFEGAVLKAIVDFEINQNTGTNWRLDSGGLARIVEDYTFLRDYHNGKYKRYLESVVRHLGPAFLNQIERQNLIQLKDKTEEERIAWLTPKVNERIQPFLYFTFSLCRQLQESENFLTTSDAYWLGAVDEIMGNKGFPSLREAMENRPKKPAPNPSTTAPAPPSAQSAPSAEKKEKRP